MQFLSYHKINGVYENLMELYKKIDCWCVCEKVHGANFSFHFNTKENKIKFGKRTSYIEEDDIFFGYNEILPNVLPKIHKIIEIIQNKYENIENIIIYGELFGGLYGNIKSKSKPIQKEVQYIPNLDFYAFDIYLKEIEKEQGLFIDYEECCKIFKEVNIFYAEPLLVCKTIEEALNFNINFNTTIPKKYGLEEIENNKAEGVIIRNMKKIDQNIFEMNDDYDLMGRMRKVPPKIMIKLKIPEFMENKSENYSLKTWKEKAKAQMTGNRLQSAISKVGELDDKNHNDIYKVYIEDILEEIGGKEVNGLKQWLYKVHNIRE